LVTAPHSLTLKRHRDLAGRAHEIWIRRGLFLVLVVIVGLALANVFGQHPATSRASSPAASLEVYSPKRVRGGLMFESRFTITAHVNLDTPKLVLDSGWFEQMTINSLEPSASAETSRNGKMVLTFDSLKAGQKLVFWGFFQVNPTNVGHRSQNVELDNGDTPLLRIKRSITIFP
jgi:hypothetical protein